MLSDAIDEMSTTGRDRKQITGSSCGTREAGVELKNTDILPRV